MLQDFPQPNSDVKNFQYFVGLCDAAAYFLWHAENEPDGSGHDVLKYFAAHKANFLTTMILLM